MSEILVHNFPNLGFLSVTLTDEQMAPIRQGIAEIQSDYNKAEKVNQYLSANIEKEFRLPKLRYYIEQLTLPLLDAYNQAFDYHRFIKMLDKDGPMKMDDPWVNIQAKGEFNPAHDHAGVYSFVIYVQIPFTDQEEIAAGHPTSLTPLSGKFEFIYSNILGHIRTIQVPADRSWENRLLLWPAGLVHQVYPFCSTNEYRITVSGNYVIANNI